MITEVKSNLPSALRQPRPIQCTIFANRNCAVDIGYFDAALDERAAQELLAQQMPSPLDIPIPQHQE